MSTNQLYYNPKASSAKQNTVILEEDDGAAEVDIVNVADRVNH